ncbi:methanogen output domain 1-containing protein [Caenispirillum bisanense]|uniref:Metanogen output domain-containing protein n=1 Tax=Caenispirillum bisanense TaxID=414052 RepID=A0A286GZ36_9PROT|nr:methanogen output domain 1-containing protein [Caenispirillum bisanense]SOE00790.1 hypothetical protein SAMN05421508_11438 [Caenispirillum bisanense]
MTEAAEAAVDLDRDGFVRQLVSQLAATLEDVVGLEGAAGYISVVGAAMGRDIDARYKLALGTDRLDRRQVADVLVDLKRRIHGDFYVVEEDEIRIVFGNRACPFGDRVVGRPSLCMMTSNVFGYIAAENQGYARIELTETIARGHAGCRVVVHLVPEDDPDPDAREYFGPPADER